MVVTLGSTRATLSALQFVVLCRNDMWLFFQTEDTWQDLATMGVFPSDKTGKMEHPHWVSSLSVDPEPAGQPISSPRKLLLCQGFPNKTHHGLGGLAEPQPLIPQLWDGAWKLIFQAGSQEMWMLLVQGPHSEKHRGGPFPGPTPTLRPHTQLLAF